MLITLVGYIILLLKHCVNQISSGVGVFFYSERLVVVAEHCEQSLEDLLREGKPVRYCIISGQLHEKQKLANKRHFN